MEVQGLPLQARTDTVEPPFRVSENGHGPVTAASPPTSRPTSTQDLSEPTVVEPQTPKQRKRPLSVNTNTSTQSSAEYDSSSPIHDDYSRLLSPASTASKGFRARESMLDREALYKREAPFRGWMTLFWLVISYFIIHTIINNVRRSGIIVGLGTFTHFTQDFFWLALSDVVMVSMTLLAYAQHRLVLNGTIKSRKASLILQHTVQVMFLVCSLLWIWRKDWPWLQNGSFCTHTIAMMMKMHSYSSVNRKFAQRKEAADEITKRLKSDDDMDELKRTKLEHEREALQQALTKGGVSYPQNVTVANFIDYLLIPTFVYELSYPRTKHIRWSYVLEKTFGVFMTFFILYLAVEHYVVPVLLESYKTPFVEMIYRLLIPFLICYLLVFYIIFECITNGFAELTCFADRHFYDDWWNSKSFEEFARRWNKPVHEFLLRHVYSALRSNFGVSKTTASYATFLLSSCLHELVLVVTSRRFRMYFFLAQMGQIPLIWLGRTKVVSNRPWLGNAIFWCGMFVGPPLLAVGYCREHYLTAYPLGAMS